MFGSLRNVLIAGMIAAMGSVGVSWAATGSPNPINMVDHGQPGAVQDNAATGSSDVTQTGSSPVTETAHGPQRSTVGCNGFKAGENGVFNHGQFVRQSPKGSRDEAAQSDCGKPEQATVHPEETSEPSESPDVEDTPEATPGQSGGNGNSGNSSDHGNSGDHGKSGEQHGNSADHSNGHGHD